MFKKRIVSLSIIFILIFTSATSFSKEAILSNSFDKGKLDKGLISINYSPSKNLKLKVMISKGTSKYTYDIRTNNQFPLQLGDGKYTISILENIEGNKYRLLEKEELNLGLIDKNKVFLQSIQLINWNEDMEAIKKAKDLTKDAKSDLDKVKAIHSYIVNNISYDKEKIKNLQAGYLPSIEETFKSSKGICYDYSALFSAMLRSIGIPTKLVMGYNNDIKEYHAWNQVYLKETNEWIIIDTTYDSAYVKNELSVPMIKNPKEYLVEKEY